MFNVYGKNTTTPPTSYNKRRVKGVSFIAVFLVVVAMLTGLAVNVARVQQSVLASTASNTITLQAYQYAESKAEIVRSTKYTSLTAQAKKDIIGSNYQDEVLLSEESDIDDHKERAATINVYQGSESMPRARLIVIRSTVEKSSGVPIGTVVAWPSHIMPTDGGTWLLCNGQSTAAYPQLKAVVGSNVPNYQGIFLRGYGSQVSTHFGTVTHTSAALDELQGDSIRNIIGTFPLGLDYHYNLVTGVFRAYGQQTGYIKEGSGGDETVEFNAGRVVPTSEEVRPINRSVNWIIRAA